MIQDIEEESKTKFSMDVEFSFSFKGTVFETLVALFSEQFCGIIIMGKGSGFNPFPLYFIVAFIILHPYPSFFFVFVSALFVLLPAFFLLEQWFQLYLVPKPVLPD